MKSLLARINAEQLKSTGLSSKGASRSASIASSFDVDDEEQQSLSDESQKTLKPKLKREKDRKDKEKDNKPSWNTKPAPKKPASRIDTNMVKLKLLDATRKAVLDKTKKPLTSSATQTDTIKTKLCKDQSIDAQIDLVNPVDKQTETDIDFVALKSRDGVVIVSASVSINTDETPTNSISTQTVMPRSNVAFGHLTTNKHKIRYLDDEEDESDSKMELKNIEDRFKTRSKLSRQKSKNIDIVIEDESDVIAIETFETILAGDKGETTDSEFEDSIHEEIIIPRNKNVNTPGSTVNSWNGLNYPLEEKVELSKNYFSEGPTPWSNFQDLVLGTRFLNTRLSPVPMQTYRPDPKQVTWSDSQKKIMNDLMNEANSLLEMFDQVAMLLGPDIKLHNVSDSDHLEMSPNPYNEEMIKSCDALEKSLRKLKDFDIDKM